MASNVAEKVRALIKSTVEEQGVRLWDVRFLKEGASWYLRVFIDSDNGVNIDDCTNVSHAIDPILDEADPIDKSYFLEVCSPGLMRELVRPEHFSAMTDRNVRVCLYADRDGKREYLGKLTSCDGDGTVTVETEDGTKEFSKGEYSRVLLDDDMEENGK